MRFSGREKDKSCGPEATLLTCSQARLSKCRNSSQDDPALTETRLFPQPVSPATACFQFPPQSRDVWALAGAPRSETAALELTERRLPVWRHPHLEPPADAGEICSEMAANEGHSDGGWCLPFRGTCFDDEA